MAHFDIGFVRKQSRDPVTELVVEDSSLGGAIRQVIEQNGPDTLITLAHRRPAFQPHPVHDLHNNVDSFWDR